MSGSGRKHKSLWDHTGGPQLPAQISEKDAWHENKSSSDLYVSHDPKLSHLEDEIAFKTKDFSGCPSWERSKGSVSQMEDIRDLNDFPDARKAWGGDRNYHVSSAFDRLEPQNRSRSPENSRKLSPRYRSRSRDRDMGRSRSPSRGRGRSRDRDWDKGSRKGRSRSRSPLGNYRQESYRWSDKRKSGLGGLPSQPCREFASGKCRRGSECRFLHQDNLNHKDGWQSERERSDRWRTAQERAGNGYDGEKDDHTRSSGKSAALCNNFMKGWCHRGSFCRFSHDDATGYNSERGNRDSSFDDNYKWQPRTSGNTLCKFFMMGSCNRDNCRFSHNGPGPGYTEGKSLDNTRSKDFDDTNNSWKGGPKRGEATAVSNVSQFTGWSNVGKETFVDEKNKPWNGPKWGEATTVPDVSQFTGWSNVEVETFIDPAPAEKRTDDSWSNAGKATFVDEMNKPRSGPKWGGATTVPDVSQFAGWSNVEAETFIDPAPAEKRTDDSWSNEGKGTFVDEMNKRCSGPKRGGATTVSKVSQFTGWNNGGKETFVDEKNKPWNGLKWGEATTVPDVSQFTGWSNVEVETFIDPAPAEKQTDDSWSNAGKATFVDEMNKPRSDPKWGGATTVPDVSQFTGWSNVEVGTFIDPAPAEKRTDDSLSNVGKGTFVDEMNKRCSGPKRGGATTVPKVSQFTAWNNVGKEAFVNEKNKPWNGPNWGRATTVPDASQFSGWNNVGKETFVDEKNKPWNGPKWGGATTVPDVSQFSGWSNVEVDTFIDPAPAEESTDDKRGNGLEDKNKSGLKWGGATGVSEIVMSTRSGNSSGENTNLANLAYAEKHLDVEKSLDCEYPPCSRHGLQPLTPFQVSEDVHEQIIGQEASGRPHPTTVMHSNFPEDSLFQQHHNQMGDSNDMTHDFNSLTGVDVYASAPHPAFVPVQNSNKKADSFPSVGGIDQSQLIVSTNPSNELDIDLNGPVQQNYSPLQNQSRIQHGESVQLTVVNNDQVGQVSTFPSSLMQIIGNGQLPQLYAALNPPKSIELVSPLPHSANLLPTVTVTNTHPDPASISQKQCNPIADSIKPTKNDSTEQNSVMLLKRSSPQSTVRFDSVKLHKNDFPVYNSQRSPALRQQKTVADSGYEENRKSIAEKRKLEQENTRTGNVDATPRILDGNTEKDEKAMRLFKIALVEFVKEILKPKWKEGQMSREVHKSVVKKVVDKVTSIIQGANMPKTQDNIDQYLSYSKPKLTKLVEAYTEKFSKCP